MKHKIQSERKLPEDNVKVRTACSWGSSIKEHTLSISVDTSARIFAFYSDKHLIIHVGNNLPRLGWGWEKGGEASDLCH